MLSFQIKSHNLVMKNARPLNLCWGVLKMLNNNPLNSQNPHQIPSLYCHVNIVLKSNHACKLWWLCQWNNIHINVKKFLDVMFRKLPNEFPPRKQIDHAIDVTLGVAPLAKAPYQTNHEELKGAQGSTWKTPCKRVHQLTSRNMGHPRPLHS